MKSFHNFIKPEEAKCEILKWHLISNCGKKLRSGANGVTRLRFVRQFRVTGPIKWELCRSIQSYCMRRNMHLNRNQALLS